MKNKQVLLIAALVCCLITRLTAQVTRSTITILNIDTKGVPADAQQMGNMVRTELEKLDTFDVTDRYDVAYIIDKNKLNVANCYGKMCLLEVGSTIKSDYMYSGSVELYGQTIVMTFRLIDVKKGAVERTTVMEFLNLPIELQQMAGITIKKMFGFENDPEMITRLTKKNNYENATNNPDRDRLGLQGPRFGYTYSFGKQASVLSRPVSEGGYNASPAMFQFGYQFEVQYLNEGSWQALCEFIPLITGIDQQLVIPSIVILNGFRNNKHGWELAIGPSVSLASYAHTGQLNGKYYTEEELKKMERTDIATTRSLDSRGELALASALVIALGKTLKSGKLNVPVNVWATVPTHDGFRVGVSVGYNSKK